MDLIITIRRRRSSVAAFKREHSAAPAARYKSRIREAVYFSSVGDRNGSRVVSSGSARGRTAKPCPLASTTERPLVFTSRAKTWRPATMSRCISTRSFRTASIRSPTSSLVSEISVVPCLSYGYLRRAWSVWKIKRRTSLSAYLSISFSDVSSAFRCGVRI